MFDFPSDYQISLFVQTANDSVISNSILKSRRVSDLILPAANFESASNEMRILVQEGITLHPVRTVRECQKTAFGADDHEIVRRIKERFETAARPIQPV